MASEFDAMLRSPAWGLLLEFWEVQVQGHLNSLEVADTYEEFLKAKADMNAIKRARNGALFLLNEIKEELASTSADGISPDGNRG